MFLQAGARYFDPDEAARRILQAKPGLSQADANAAARHQGTRLLGRAIAEHLTCAFETTLGGRTIAALLVDALASGLPVRVWHVGLDGVDLHLRRVRARRARRARHSRGPGSRARRRQPDERDPSAAAPDRALCVCDNTAEADLHAGAPPAPRLVLHMVRARVVESCPLAETPAWARPIVAAALVK